MDIARIPIDETAIEIVILVRQSPAKGRTWLY